MSAPLLRLSITNEVDVVLARQRARTISELLGLDAQEQTRVATAVSEIARNAFTYAQQGSVEFRLEGSTKPQVLVIQVTDRGPGIEDLAKILEGRYRSSTGMGLGILGARRLMDQFEVASERGKGTSVRMKKLLPASRTVLGPREVQAIGDALARQRPQGPVEELQRQNQELLRTLEEVVERQEELVVLNRELEDTNRGVVALYAELDEKADHLRRADDLKSKFLSNMSHEFRTPVNSIQALASLLLDRTDGELTPEQERQVSFIRRAADELAELVNDLLDLAKVEAGKIEVRPTIFEVSNLFGALRGMLRPLLVNSGVALVFEEPEGIPPLHTDEAKVSQIVRNFISNALKFTERGHVRVSARVVPGGEAIAFEVEDTGIGIAPQDQERIFQEFTQIESPLQRKVRGTGLGLPLCRKLATLLGGSVSMKSELGVGSVFTAIIPILYAPSLRGEHTSWEAIDGRVPVLVVEDSAETAMLYEKYLASAGCHVFLARSIREAREAMKGLRPRLIVLDILLRGEDAWGFLTELKRRPDTKDIPLMIVTSTEDEGKALALGADAFLLKPVDRQRFVSRATQLLAPESVRRVLVVDDEEVSRYLLRQSLAAPHIEVLEAVSGDEALRMAARHRPGAICLDLKMPGGDGTQVLRALKENPDTCDIPVIIVTSMALEPGERRGLLDLAAGVLPKEALSRGPILAQVEEAMRRRSAV